MKKIELYKWGTFSSAGKFGWSISVLNIFWVTEYPVYIQKHSKNLFYIGHGLNWGFDEKRNMFFEGKKLQIELLFMSILSLYTVKKYMTEKEYMEGPE